MNSQIKNATDLIATNAEDNQLINDCDCENCTAIRLRLRDARDAVPDVEPTEATTTVRRSR
jgi:hypothetical protein